MSLPLWVAQNAKPGYAFIISVFTKPIILNILVYIL